MTEQTITLTDGNGRNSRTLTEKDWQILKDMGMLWKFHPDAPEYWPHPSEPTPSAAPLPAVLEPLTEVNRLKGEKADLLLETILLRQVIERITRADHMSTVDAILAEWRQERA